jgi:hypothetical protein
MLKSTDYPPGWLDAILRPKEAARECGISEATLERHGPPKLHLSPRRAAYRRGDLLAWLNERRAVIPMARPLQDKAERPRGRSKKALAAAALAVQPPRRTAKKVTPAPAVPRRQAAKEIAVST